MENKYAVRSKISEAKFREIVKYFAADLTATQIADFTGINRNTINRYLMAMRKIIYRHCAEIQRKEVGEIECDESYFGPRRVKGMRGRGAAGKTIVLVFLSEMERSIPTLSPTPKPTRCCRSSAATPTRKSL